MPKAEFYSLKEMLEEVRKQNQDALVSQNNILSELKSIHERLDTVTKIVEKNRERLSKLEAFKESAMLVWGGATFVITTGVSWLLNKY